MGHGAAAVTEGISLLPGWLFLPAHILQGAAAASYKHSCYTEMQRGSVALHYIILAHCLDNLKIIEGDERCDSCAFSPQGDVLSQSSLVFCVSQAEREVRNESLNQTGIERRHCLQDAVDLPVVHSFVLLHKRPTEGVQRNSAVNAATARGLNCS